MFSLFYRLNKSRGQDEGLTLIECLVAISVIALTSATIAPVLVLSVATRVQNQKSEQALQLARGEVDRIRLLIERNPTYTSDDLLLPQAGYSLTPSTPLSSVTGPTSALSLTASELATYSVADEYTARQIDTDGDLSPDFIVQSFRGSSAMVDTMPVSFSMGVRVYDADAVDAAPDGTFTGLLTEPARLGVTSGNGDRGKRPLAALYTQIINSDDSQSLCSYIEFLGESVPTTMSCN